MDVKVHNIWLMVMHIKEVEAPACFTATDISGIQIELNFIKTGAKLHGGAIMTLVDIFVYIFDGLNRCNRLHIDVASVLPDEIVTVVCSLKGLGNPLVQVPPCMQGELELY